MSYNQTVKTWDTFVDSGGTFSSDPTWKESYLGPGGGGTGTGGVTYGSGTSGGWPSNPVITGTTNPISVQTNTPTAPVDGQIAEMGGKLFQWSEISQAWVQMSQVIPESQIEEAPKLPIILDASRMLTAMKAYRDFLDDLELELPIKQQEAVRQTLFGLEEAIQGLEQI